VRIVPAAAGASLVACVVVWFTAAPAGAVRPVPVDFGVKLVGPVDTGGRPSGARVTAGAAFLVRVELFTDASAGAASVTYDVDLPTGVRIAARRLRLPTGALTSSCLRACSIGWNTDRSRRLFVYYRFVTPGPGEFIVEARLVSTNRSDARAGDDSGSATIVAVPARLALGQPLLAAGPPVAGRSFEVTVPVRRSGVAVQPTRGMCAGLIDDRALRVVVSLGRGRIGCTWSIPPGSAGKTLRTTVGATAGSLRARTTWVYAIRG
jgi:hypothetical protein